MTPEQVKLLIGEGEGLTLEFKARYTPRIDEDIVAFANARGGTLLLGVRDDGNISGAMIAAGLREPTFEPNRFFRVIFHRSPELAMKEGIPDIADTGKRVGVKTAQKTAQKIIAIIRKNPMITRQELAMELEITNSGVKYHLKKLQDKGFLRRVGPDKGGHWEVIL